MGGNIPPAAVTLRHLIDRGPDYKPPEAPLPPPWDALYQAVLASGATYRTRASAFRRAVAQLPDSLRITLQVEDALKPDVGEGFPSAFDPDSKKRFIPASVALHPRQPPEYLIPDFISHPSLNLVVGMSGSKKTYAVLDLAVCIALGVPWLDCPTKQAGVLWVDEESSQFRFLTRLAQVMRAHDAPPDLPLHFSSLAGFDFRDPQDVHIISETAYKTGANLIVIDPLTGVIPGVDENSVFHLGPIFRTLRTLAYERFAAVILIHHTNKSGIYRGSSHLLGAVDLMLMTHSRADTPFIEFQTIKTRDVPPHHFAAHINFDPPQGRTDRVWLSPTDLPQARLAVRTDQPLSPAAQHILDYLHQHGPSPTKKITHSAQNCTPRQVRKAIFKLIEIGLIERTDTGGQGIPATYALIE